MFACCYCPVSLIVRGESPRIERPEWVRRAWPGTGCSVGTNQYSGADRASAPCVRHDKVGNPGQHGGPVGGPGPARAKTCRPAADTHDAGNLACATAPCTAFGAGAAALAIASSGSSEALAAAGALKPAPVPGTMRGFS